MTEITQTLQRLAQGFIARDIMVPASDLICGATLDEAKNLLTEYPQYDLIPIRRANQIVAYLERGSSGITSLRIEHLTSDGTPILDVLDALAKHRQTFLVARQEIAGMIHFSDLSDPVVKLPFFVLLEALERRLADLLRGRINEQNLPSLIPDGQRCEFLFAKMRNLRAKRADKDFVTLLYFKEILQAAKALGVVSLKGDRLDQLAKVRTLVAHAAIDELVESHDDVRRLRLVRDTSLELLIGQLERPNNALEPSLGGGL